MNNFIIIQINKGKSEFQNNIQNIKILLEDKKPHVLMINESNLSVYDNISKHSFPNYNFEKDQLGPISKQSRTVVLVHETVRYKRLKNIEPKFNSVIWLKINLGTHGTFLLHCIYRQWQVIGQKQTDSIPSQLKDGKTPLKYGKK